METMQSILCKKYTQSAVLSDLTLCYCIVRFLTVSLPEKIISQNNFTFSLASEA